MPLSNWHLQESGGMCLATAACRWDAWMMRSEEWVFGGVSWCELSCRYCRKWEGKQFTPAKATVSWGDLTCIKTNSDWDSFSSPVIMACSKAYFALKSFTLQIMWRFSWHEWWWIPSWITIILFLTFFTDDLIWNHTTVESFQPAR